MQREPDGTPLALLREPLAQEAREEHEMVVVDPDEVASFGGGGDDVGEDAVYLFIRLPGGIFEVDAGLVVEDWPEDGVCIDELVTFPA